MQQKNIKQCRCVVILQYVCAPQSETLSDALSAEEEKNLHFKIF